MPAFERFIRKIRRWADIPVDTTLARCAGTSADGAACRIAAMDNGYCRLHGGVHYRSLAEIVR